MQPVLQYMHELQGVVGIPNVSVGYVEPVCSCGVE